RSVRAASACDRAHSAPVRYHGVEMTVIGKTGQNVLRRRVAAVALSVVLFALVAYWASLDDEERRPRARARRPVRAAGPGVPVIFACETLAVGRAPYGVDYAAWPRPGPRRTVRLVPYRPVR